MGPGPSDLIQKQGPGPSDLLMPHQHIEQHGWGLRACSSDPDLWIFVTEVKQRRKRSRIWSQSPWFQALGSNFEVCDLEYVIHLSCASVFSSVKWA